MSPDVLWNYQSVFFGWFGRDRSSAASQEILAVSSFCHPISEFMHVRTFGIRRDVTISPVGTTPFTKRYLAPERWALAAGDRG